MQKSIHTEEYAMGGGAGCHEATGKPLTLPDEVSLGLRFEG